MDIQRALEIIQRKSSIPNDGESFAEIEKAYDMAIEALEKQIAKKVKTKWKQPNAFYGKCPVCDCNIVRSQYCPRCGHKLDWSEV